MNSHNDLNETPRRAGPKMEQIALNELTGVERVYGVAAMDQTLLLRYGRKLIKLSAATNQ